MHRILLTMLLISLVGILHGQSEDPPETNPTEWIIKIGMNALHQPSDSKVMKAKSSLGFHVGGDLLWDPGWKIKFGLLYQHHEIFEFNNLPGQLTQVESQDRYLQRLKLSAGTGYDFLSIDFLTLGVGADLAYNFNLTQNRPLFSNFGNSLKIDYLSSIFHLYANLNRFQIDFGLEGNLSSHRERLGFFESKTYSLTFGYIF